MNEAVAAIIKKRKRGIIFYFVIVCALVVGATVSDTGSPDFKLIAIISTIMLVPGIAIYAVNIDNYPVPKPYYRTFNRWVYNYLAKVTIIFSLLSALVNLRRALNPFDGGDKSTELFNAAIDGSVAADMYQQLKPAAAIEEYFAAKSQPQPPQVAPPIAPPPIAASPLPASPPETPSTYTRDNSTP